jgi:hypothetical protein
MGWCKNEGGTCSSKEWTDVNECWTPNPRSGKYQLEACEGWTNIGPAPKKPSSTARLLVMTNTLDEPLVHGVIDIPGLPAGMTEFSAIHICSVRNQITLVSNTGRTIWTTKFKVPFGRKFSDDKGFCLDPFGRGNKFDLEIENTGYVAPLPPGICNAMSVTPSTCFNSELYDFAGTRYQNAAKPATDVETFVVANAWDPSVAESDQCFACSSGLVDERNEKQIFEYNQAVFYKMFKFCHEIEYFSSKFKVVMDYDLSTIERISADTTVCSTLNQHPQECNVHPSKFHRKP